MQTGNLTEGDWERLILLYLRTKGHKEAELALQRSAGIDETDMSLTHRLNLHKGVVEQLVSTFALEADPSSYVTAFDRLVRWVEGSLDIHRAELSRVLYPSFLHTYLYLVSRGESQAAGPFLDRFKRRFEEMPGGLSQARAQELQELRRVAVKQDLTTNQFAKQLATAKHTVPLSSYAHSLLMHFLHGSSAMLPLSSIINQHISLQIMEGRLVPGTAEQEGGQGQGQEAEEMQLGVADSSALAINQAHVNLTLLKGTPEDRYLELNEQRELDEALAEEARVLASLAVKEAGAGAGEEAEEGEGEEGAGGAGAGAGDAAAAAAAAAAATAAAGAGIGEDGKFKSKKERRAEAKAKAAAVAASVKARREARQERMEPLPWMGQLSDAVQAAWLSDVEHRSHVSPSQLPSCCFFTFANTRQSLTCVTFQSDVTRIAAGYSDSSVRLYDVTKLTSGVGGNSGGGGGGPKSKAAGGGSNVVIKEEEEEDEEESRLNRATTFLYGHTGPVHALDFTHDARLLLSGSADGTVRVWGTELGAGLAVFRGHLLPIWDVATAPWGLHFASASADRTARVWGTDNLRTLRILTGHQADVDLVQWHPNCHYVATASSDYTVRLWDVATGACVRLLTGLQAPPTSLAVCPDGKQIAAGSQDGSIMIWDLGSARRQAVLTGHEGPVWSLGYSLADGSVLASGGADDTVRLWGQGDGSTNKGAPLGPKAGGYSCLGTYRTKSSAVLQVQYSRRNLLLAAGQFGLKHNKA